MTTICLLLAALTVGQTNLPPSITAADEHAPSAAPQTESPPGLLADVMSRPLPPDSSGDSGGPADGGLVPAAFQEQTPIAAPEPVEVAAGLLPIPPVAPPVPVVANAGPVPVVPDRWWFMRQVQGTWIGAFLDNQRLFATGWINGSFTASTDSVTNGTVVWNDRANRFLLQQAWVRFGRSLATNSTTPSWGFQADFLIGSDYRFTLPRGLWNSQLINSTGAQNLYGVDAIQQYLAVFVPTLFRGTEFRAGRVYTPWGVESLEAVSTPLISRSYAFNWSPPFTHSGFGAYITFSPEWQAVLLAVNGNDVYWGDPSAEWRFVGNVKWTQPGGGRNTVTLATSLGSGWFNPSAPFAPATVALANEPFGRNNFNAFDVVYTHTFSPVLSYNMEGIYGYQYNVPAASLNVSYPDPHGFYFANWASVAQYLFYTVNPRLLAILRWENFDDFQGQRTGFQGWYMATTVGSQFRVQKGIIWRNEIRYDFNPESTPFEGKHSILTAATDFIIRW